MTNNVLFAYKPNIYSLRIQSMYDRIVEKQRREERIFYNTLRDKRTKTGNKYLDIYKNA